MDDRSGLAFDRKALEEAIASMIREFERRHGVVVRGLYACHDPPDSGLVTGVKFEVVIP